MSQDIFHDSWSSLCRYNGKDNSFVLDDNLIPVLDSVDIGFVVQSAAGKVVYCNRLAASTFQLRPGLDIHSLLSSGDWYVLDENETVTPLSQSPATTCFETGKQTDNSIICLRRSNRPSIWINLRCHPLFTPGISQPSAVILTFTDITEERSNRSNLKELS